MCARLRAARDANTMNALRPAGVWPRAQKLRIAQEGRTLGQLDERGAVGCARFLAEHTGASLGDVVEALLQTSIRPVPEV